MDPSKKRSKTTDGDEPLDLESAIGEKGARLVALLVAAHGQRDVPGVAQAFEGVRHLLDIDVFPLEEGRRRHEEGARGGWGCGALLH
jgi:hypothetical protein